MRSEPVAEVEWTALRAAQRAERMARVFSGIQPTGEMHLGNYLGAVRHWVAEQEEHDSIHCVVDLHAMTQPYDPRTLADRTRRTAALLLAAGLDPDRCTLFVQSHVHEHTELTWILNCVATFGELRRMTQFKEKGKGQESVSVGLFDYPVLMAADILAYDTDRVPVGDDQRQHLELARDVASRFNHRFGETFVVPEAAIPPVAARVMDLQEPTAKMSKSAESPGTVTLLEDPKTITKRFKSAVTDSANEIRFDPDEKPGVSNLVQILAATTGRDPIEVAADCEGQGYGALKSAVADAVVALLAPIQARYAELEADPRYVDRALALGAEKAQETAAKVVARARDAAGLLPRA
jgi:tryptophanyl-tRNA synthetase